MSVIGRMLAGSGGRGGSRTLAGAQGGPQSIASASSSARLGGLQHQRRHVLAHVGQRLVLAAGRTRVSVQVADDVAADGDRLRPQHAIGDDRRVGHVGALDGDGAGGAWPDHRLAVHHQRQRLGRAQGDARVPGAGRRGTKIERAAELSDRHRVEAAHQPAAEPVAAEAAEAARHRGVEVDVDGDGGARRQRHGERDARDGVRAGRRVFEGRSPPARRRHARSPRSSRREKTRPRDRASGSSRRRAPCRAWPGDSGRARAERRRAARPSG